MRHSVSWIGWAGGLLLVLLAVTVPVSAGGNLVVNGDFERATDDKKPEYWHYRLADFMPKATDNGDGTKSYRYICGCGNDLGAAKPWCGLQCPKCKGFLSGDEYGGWYLQNHEYVSVVPGGPSGNCVKFTMPPDIGNNQGVRIFSQLIQAKRGWGYKLSFECKATNGGHPRVFVESYRFIETGGSKFKSKYMTEVNKELDPDGTRKPIERIFRAHVNCEGSPTWKTYTKEFIAPERYQFDWMTVKLYGYMPGEVYFDNVSLVPMTSSEMFEYDKSRRRPKDQRFKHEGDKGK